MASNLLDISMVKSVKTAQMLQTQTWNLTPESAMKASKMLGHLHGLKKKAAEISKITVDTMPFWLIN